MNRSPLQLKGIGYLVALCLLGSYPGLALSQPRPDLVGSIDFEDAGGKADPYSTSQEQAIKAFSEAAQRAQAKESYANTTLSEGALNYLTGVYLFCSVNQGTCPVVLDGLLEFDYLHSLVKGSAECPNLKSFWKKWIQNDMEKRHGYLIKTGFIAETQNFKQNVRPKYIRCDDTIAGLMKAHPTPKARYIAQANTFDELTRILTSIKSHIPNIFLKMGVAPAGEKK